MLCAGLFSAKLERKKKGENAVVAQICNNVVLRNNLLDCLLNSQVTLNKDINSDMVMKQKQKQNLNLQEYIFCMKPIKDEQVQVVKGLGLPWPRIPLQMDGQQRRGHHGNNIG